MSTTTTIPVAAWREARVFDARERAALALCEAMTHVADRPVPDAVRAAAVINTRNRLDVAVGTEPGHDVPGRFAA